MSTQSPVVEGNLPVNPRLLSGGADHLIRPAVPDQIWGCRIMGFHIPYNGLPVVICIAVKAAMAAGIIRPDIISQKTAALLSGRLSAAGNQKALSDGLLQHLPGHTSAAVDAERSQLIALAAGVQALAHSPTLETESFLSAR